MFIRSFTIMISVIFCFSCRPIDEVNSQFSVVEPNMLSKRCKENDKGLNSLSALAFGSWTRISYSKSPCKENTRRDFGLQDGDRKNNVTVIAYPYSADGRIPENVNRMIQNENELGNHVIPIQNPQPGDIRNAISRFSVDHPNVKNANEVNILIHGHGETTYAENQPEFRPPMAFPPQPITEDTIVSDSYYPNNYVELPRHNQFSAKDATREALVTAQQSGITGDNTNCNLFLGTCQAGGAVQAIGQEWPTWEKLGLDSAVGASAPNEYSYDNPQLPQNLPSENLLGTYYALKRNPQRKMDLNNDSVIDLGEMKQTAPALGSLHFSGYVLGQAQPDGTERAQTIGVESNPIVKVPYTDIPVVSEKYDYIQQNLSFAGKDTTPIFKFDTPAQNSEPILTEAPPPPKKE